MKTLICDNPIVEKISKNVDTTQSLKVYIQQLENRIDALESINKKK